MTVMLFVVGIVLVAVAGEAATVIKESSMTLDRSDYIWLSVIAAMVIYGLFWPDGDDWYDD